MSNDKIFVHIEFDVKTGNCGVNAPMSNEQDKLMALDIIALAQRIIIGFKPNAIIRPATNGKLPPITAAGGLPN